MTDDRTITIPGTEVEALARILRRSIATDTAEVRRLTMLGTAYHDRPAGSDVDAELRQARDQRNVAEALLARLAP
ncbi:MAG: hypothetical protein EPO36_02275 [Chloroflexota bacterium]|nr:MAG: hypothetical protein EPO36_02275 [Chloroflexota bacterium]